LVAAGLSHRAPASSEIELGTGCRVLVLAAPLRTTGGCVVVFHDVTEMRRLEAVRRNFVANVSHELRTPTSVIRANAETLLDGAVETEEQARVFLTAVHRNAERLAQIIDDLLDLAGIEAGEYEHKPIPTELGPAVRRVVESLGERIKAKNQVAHVDVPNDLLVRADIRALDQVLLNLIDNAVKYTQEGGQVTVRSAKLEHGVRIEVEDNGPGIEPKHRQRIFERFYRVEPGRSREMGGTGLGLSIVKHLVAAMGGESGFAPVSPRGSVFWFTLTGVD